VYISFKPQEKGFHAAKQVDKSILVRTYILDSLRDMWVKKSLRSVKEHAHLEKNTDSGKDRCRRWEYLWSRTSEGRAWVT
jgi:hypothetical protein